MFTTEGHILKLGSKHLKPVSPSRQKLRKIEDHQCPAHQPFKSAYNDNIGLVVGVRGRADADWSRELVNLEASEADSANWSPSGWCEQPKVDLFVCVSVQWTMGICANTLLLVIRLCAISQRKGGC